VIRWIDFGSPSRLKKKGGMVRMSGCYGDVGRLCLLGFLGRLIGV